MSESPRKSILLVEDDLLIGMDEARQLTDCGFNVTHVASGEEAIALLRARRHPVDLILMDIDLGKGMDGTAASSLILAEHDVPIVFLSSHTEREIVEKTETITSYGYVVKTSGITVLLASIRMAFRLFDAYGSIKRQKREIEVRERTLQTAVEELQAANEEFETINRQLMESERELMKSETFLNGIIDQSPYPMWISDGRGTLIRINRACLELLNASEEELVGKYNLFQDNILEDQGLLPEIRRVYENGDVIRFELRYDSRRLNRIALKRFATAILDVSVFPVRDGRGNITNAVIQHIDITERRRNEEKIRALLDEKELLVKETYHRVKNNMNVIKSLLLLHASTHTDPTLKTVISDTAGRLQSMIGLYDKLYRSDNHLELNIRDFLPPLVEEIIGIFHLQKPVSADIQVEDFILSAKILLPVGIVINEIITNSMKYAFEGIACGVISVSAKKSDDRVTVTCGDNGVGLPESVSPDRSTGFGLTLIGLLIQQLQGTVSIDRSRGTVYRMDFPG